MTVRLEISERDMRRFWAKVVIDPSGCLIWTASKVENGYGKLYCRGRSILAHRFAYTALVSEIPKGLQLDHLCRVRNCVNPDHLEPVTPCENVRRSEPAQRTHCPAGHPYDEVNTRLRANGWRDCRACETARESARGEGRNARRRARWAADRESINAGRRARRAARKNSQ